MIEMNRTPRAAGVAELMLADNFESHRGAMRWKRLDTAKTDCVALYGNDGYSGDDDVDRQARTVAYVHGLYVGWSNLLPEGAVEFGTSKDGYTWAILLHLPKRAMSLPLLMRSLVWDLWQANLPSPACSAQKGGAR